MNSLKRSGLTPFSREELALASQRQTKEISELERARRFFVCARQVRTGLAQTSSAGRWAHCLLTSRAGMAGAVSRWLGSVDDLSLIAQRLLRVQIENAPAIEVPSGAMTVLKRCFIAIHLTRTMHGATAKRTPMK